MNTSDFLNMTSKALTRHPAQGFFFEWGRVLDQIMEFEGDFLSAFLSYQDISALPNLPIDVSDKWIFVDGEKPFLRTRGTSRFHKDDPLYRAVSLVNDGVDPINKAWHEKQPLYWDVSDNDGIHRAYFTRDLVVFPDGTILKFSK
jgi:hypothetical protein